MGFCRNCEGTYPCETVGDVLMVTLCPYCALRHVPEFLTVVGTTPTKAENKL